MVRQATGSLWTLSLGSLLLECTSAEGVTAAKLAANAAAPALGAEWSLALAATSSLAQAKAVTLAALEVLGWHVAAWAVHAVSLQEPW